MRRRIVCLALLGVVPISGSGQASATERRAVTPPPTASLVKTLAVTTTAEGGSARPEIVATSDRVFVLYLGDIVPGGSRTFRLKVYDAALNRLISSSTLVSTTPTYGGPTDIRVASEGRALYAFYETHRPNSPTTATTYLWGAKYTLADGFRRVAYTRVPHVVGAAEARDPAWVAGLRVFCG